MTAPEAGGRRCEREKDPVKGEAMGHCWRRSYGGDGRRECVRSYVRRTNAIAYDADRFGVASAATLPSPPTISSTLCADMIKRIRNYINVKIPPRK